MRAISNMDSGVWWLGKSVTHRNKVVKNMAYKSSGLSYFILFSILCLKTILYNNMFMWRNI